MKLCRNNSEIAPRFISPRKAGFAFSDLSSDPNLGALADNGGVNWTNVETLGPAGQAAGWKQHSFLVSDYLSVQGALQSLPAHESSALSSFVREASVTRDRPPVLFAQVDESWELLSTESRRKEAESLFEAAKTKWGTRDGFLHRGNALVAHSWSGEVTVFGSLHGDEE